MKFPKSTISASYVKSYYDCPRGWYLVNIKGYQPPKGPALTFGSMWDCMFKSFHEGKDPLEIAKNECLSHPPTKDELTAFSECKQILENYKLNPYMFIKPIFQVQFKTRLIHPHTKKEIPFPLFGYLDGKDYRPLEVRGIEVKTSSYGNEHDWGWNQKRIDTEIQADIYCYHLYNDEKQETPEMDYLIFNKKTKLLEQLTTTRNINDFVKLYELIDQFIENVCSEKFDINPNHPKFCACIAYDKGL